MRVTESLCGMLVTLVTLVAGSAPSSARLRGERASRALSSAW